MTGKIIPPRTVTTKKSENEAHSEEYSRASQPVAVAQRKEFTADLLK